MSQQLEEEIHDPFLGLFNYVYITLEINLKLLIHVCITLSDQSKT